MYEQAQNQFKHHQVEASKAFFGAVEAKEQGKETEARRSAQQAIQHQEEALRIIRSLFEGEVVKVQRAAQ